VCRTRRTWLASAERHEVRSEASRAFCAIESFIEPFGRAAVEVGDDEADVEAEPRGLDAGDGAPPLVPGTGPVARLSVAAHDVFVADGALGANGVGGLVDFLGQRLRAGEAEHVIDVVVFAPGHRLGPGVVQ
jgi:hypothetical protein